MRIGIDFDNTIVCYDGLFHQVCLERALIPPDMPKNKSDTRNYLRKVGKEAEWTLIQGYVYGARMDEAEAFPGVIEFFKFCRDKEVEVCIISHKTRYPFQGEQYDLHAAATSWLKRQDFFATDGVGLRSDQVFFEVTRKAKLSRIEKFGCDYFIDDLPELLCHVEFPKTVRPILFDPNQHYDDSIHYTRAEHWHDIKRIIDSSRHD
jgi:hypothetical protein